MVRKIPAETRALLKVTREFVNLSYRELAKKYGVSKSVAHKVCNAKTKENSKPGRPGRPKVLCERSERKLLRTFFKLRRTSPNFSVKDLIVESGLDATKYCRRTVSRFLIKKGYKLRQARKKGLLSEKDLRLRRQYARNMKNVLKKYPNYFTNHVGFYLDGVSFVHKSDPLKAAVQPKSRVWRTKGEGLNIESHSLTHEFLGNLGPYYFQPYITQPTRITDHSATLIDNIYFNSIEHETISGNLICDITDHFPNFLILNKFTCASSKPVIYRRDYYKFNENVLLEEVRQISWGMFCLKLKM